MQANVEQIEQDIQNFKRQLKIERNLSEHTLRAYECDLHCMLRWIETYHIRALNDKVTMSYFNYLQDEECLGARSIRRKYVALRQFFEFLGETYDVHEKFFRFSSRKFQVPKTLPKTLERSEIQRLLGATSKNFQTAGTEYQIWLALRDMCILELLFSLGLRVGEAAALNVEDYREEDQFLFMGKEVKRESYFYRHLQYARRSTAGCGSGRPGN
jgi:integrase/recombinase XerD